MADDIYARALARVDETTNDIEYADRANTTDADVSFDALLKICNLLRALLVERHAMVDSPRRPAYTLLTDAVDAALREFAGEDNG